MPILAVLFLRAQRGANDKLQIEAHLGRHILDREPPERPDLTTADLGLANRGGTKNDLYMATQRPAPIKRNVAELKPRFLTQLAAKRGLGLFILGDETAGRAPPGIRPQHIVEKKHLAGLVGDYARR